MIETPLREIAREACEGGFVRADRQGALYVTDATDESKIRREGFSVQKRGSLLALIPDKRLMDVLSQWLDAPKDELLEKLRRLKDRAVTQEEQALVLDGVKRLETGAPFGAAYEKRLRQRAAVCLRKGYGGGGLWMAAALMQKGK